MQNGRSLLTRIATVGILTVMLFLVLSTATYAWYLGGSKVNIQRISFTTQVAEGSGITIGKTTMSLEKEITFDAVSEIMPMIPAKKPTEETTYEEFLDFRRTYVGIGIGQTVAMINGSEDTPATLELDGQDYFYINNLTGGDVKLFIHYDVSGGIADKLHLAMFFGTEGGGKFSCILTDGGSAHYGEIKAGDNVEATSTMPEAVSPSGEKSFVIRADESLRVRLVVWLDGVDMHDKDGEITSKFSINFTE